eukprot:jgi/Mesvir1/9300/Mv03426-RA.1
MLTEKVPIDVTGVWSKFNISSASLKIAFTAGVLSSIRPGTVVYWSAGYGANGLTGVVSFDLPGNALVKSGNAMIINFAALFALVRDKGLDMRTRDTTITVTVPQNCLTFSDATTNASFQGRWVFKPEVANLQSMHTTYVPTNYKFTNVNWLFGTATTPGAYQFEASWTKLPITPVHRYWDKTASLEFVFPSGTTLAVSSSAVSAKARISLSKNGTLTFLDEGDITLSGNRLVLATQGANGPNIWANALSPQKANTDLRSSTVANLLVVEFPAMTVSVNGTWLPNFKDQWSIERGVDNLLEVGPSLISDVEWNIDNTRFDAIRILNNVFQLPASYNTPITTDDIYSGLHKNKSIKLEISFGNRNLSLNTAVTEPIKYTVSRAGQTLSADDPGAAATVTIASGATPKLVIDIQTVWNIASSQFDMATVDTDVRIHIPHGKVVVDGDRGSPRPWSTYALGTWRFLAGTGSTSTPPSPPGGLGDLSSLYSVDFVYTGPGTETVVKSAAAFNSQWQVQDIGQWAAPFTTDSIVSLRMRFITLPTSYALPGFVTTISKGAPTLFTYTLNSSLTPISATIGAFNQDTNTGVTTATFPLGNLKTQLSTTLTNATNTIKVSLPALLFSVNESPIIKPLEFTWNLKLDATTAPVAPQTQNFSADSVSKIEWKFYRTNPELAGTTTIGVPADTWSTGTFSYTFANSLQDLNAVVDVTFNSSLTIVKKWAGNVPIACTVNDLPMPDAVMTYLESSKTLRISMGVLYSKVRSKDVDLSSAIGTIKLYIPAGVIQVASTVITNRLCTGILFNPPSTSTSTSTPVVNDPSVFSYLYTFKTADDWLVGPTPSSLGSSPNFSIRLFTSKAVTITSNKIRLTVTEGNSSIAVRFVDFQSSTDKKTHTLNYTDFTPASGSRTITLGPTASNDRPFTDVSVTNTTYPIDTHVIVIPAPTPFLSDIDFTNSEGGRLGTYVPQTFAVKFTMSVPTVSGFDASDVQLRHYNFKTGKVTAVPAQGQVEAVGSTGYIKRLLYNRTWASTGPGLLVLEIDSNKFQYSATETSGNDQVLATHYVGRLPF